MRDGPNALDLERLFIQTAFEKLPKLKALREPWNICSELLLTDCCNSDNPAALISVIGIFINEERIAASVAGRISLAAISPSKGRIR